jgi:hypothetical protein
MFGRLKTATPVAAVSMGVVALLMIGGGSAAAKALITGADIKNGSVHLVDLDHRAQAKLKGNTGATGATGAIGARGATGAAGAAGALGGIGKAGVNGLNPVTQVTANGDSGWTFTGVPAAKFFGGELRLAGGFDSTTTAGGIGITKAYPKVQLATLTALSYTVHVALRPDTLTAPTIHIALLGAVTGSTSGFMNLVFEPVNNGGTVLNSAYTFDTINGLWWGTKDTPNHPRQATASLASFVHDNPDAVITGISVDNGGSSASTIPESAVAMGADDVVVGFGNTFDRYGFGG